MYILRGNGRTIYRRTNGLEIEDLAELFDGSEGWDVSIVSFRFGIPAGLHKSNLKKQRANRD